MITSNNPKATALRVIIERQNPSNALPPIRRITRTGNTCESLKKN
jgi:hypothetical protein